MKSKLPGPSPDIHQSPPLSDHQDQAQAGNKHFDQAELLATLIIPSNSRVEIATYVVSIHSPAWNDWIHKVEFKGRVQKAYCRERQRNRMSKDVDVQKSRC